MKQNITFKCYTLSLRWYLTLYHINLLNPIIHFWLHHTAHCVSKKGGTRGQGKVGGVTRVGHLSRFLTPWTVLENTTLTL